MYHVTLNLPASHRDWPSEKYWSHFRMEQGYHAIVYLASLHCKEGHGLPHPCPLTHGLWCHFLLCGLGPSSMRSHPMPSGHRPLGIGWLLMNLGLSPLSHPDHVYYLKRQIVCFSVRLLKCYWPNTILSPANSSGKTYSDQYSSPHLPFSGTVKYLLINSACSICIPQVCNSLMNSREKIKMTCPQLRHKEHHFFRHNAKKFRKTEHCTDKKVHYSWILLF